MYSLVTKWTKTDWDREKLPKLVQWQKSFHTVCPIAYNPELCWRFTWFNMGHSGTTTTLNYWLLQNFCNVVYIDWPHSPQGALMSDLGWRFADTRQLLTKDYILGYIKLPVLRIHITLYMQYVLWGYCGIQMAFCLSASSLAPGQNNILTLLWHVSSCSLRFLHTQLHSLQNNVPLHLSFLY